MRAVGHCERAAGAVLGKSCLRRPGEGDVPQIDLLDDRGWGSEASDQAGEGLRKVELEVSTVRGKADRRRPGGAATYHLQHSAVDRRADDAAARFDDLGSSRLDIRTARGAAGLDELRTSRSHECKKVLAAGINDLRAAGVDGPKLSCGPRGNDLDPAAVDLGFVGNTVGHDELGTAVQCLIDGGADDEIEAARIDRGEPGFAPGPHDLGAAVDRRELCEAEHDLVAAVVDRREERGAHNGKPGGFPFDDLEAAAQYGVGGSTGAKDQLGAAGVDDGGAGNGECSIDELEATAVDRSARWQSRRW